MSVAIRKLATIPALLVLAASLALYLGQGARSAQASSVVVVSAGGNHTCALHSSGAVQCWGFNGQGQLGNGTMFDSSVPVDVIGLSTGSGVSAGGHSCALTSTGGVQCWGLNDNGELGDGTTLSKNTPVDATGLTSGAVAVSAGGFHTCALTTAGGVKCWGFNLFGQLGDGTLVDSSTPVDVTGLTSGVAAISAGFFQTCALTTGGGVKCWGANGNGQLGDGSTKDSSLPVDVLGLAGSAIAVSAGGFHSCAVAGTGGAKCWGFNFDGELGNSTLLNSSTPVDVTGLSAGIAAISAGLHHTCALSTPGAVTCWGSNLHGELGDGQACGITCPSPSGVNGLASGAAAVSAGGFHTCALAPAGVKCWGINASGQLGNGTNTGPELCAGTPCSTVPVDVVGLGSEPTPTPTDASTSTPTDTYTPTSTDTHTATPTDTFTSTPTDTHTPTPTDTFTPTPTHTYTPAPTDTFTPTSTDTFTPTATPSAAATRTRTPTPFATQRHCQGGHNGHCGSGDANCDGSVNAIDAIVVLQIVVGAADARSCGANTEQSGNVQPTAVDAKLILEHDAGLDGGGRHDSVRE
jgi:alpha-tubulin suppressor-like RCC1 family protein